MLFKQHQRCAVEPPEQQLLSSPRVGLEQPQDRPCTRANSADPEFLVKQIEVRNEIFHVGISMSWHLTCQVWSCIKCWSLKPFGIYGQFSFFSFHTNRTTIYVHDSGNICIFRHGTGQFNIFREFSCESNVFQTYLLQ